MSRLRPAGSARSSERSSEAAASSVLGERVERQRVEQPRLGADRHRRRPAASPSRSRCGASDVARRAGSPSSRRSRARALATGTDVAVSRSARSSSARPSSRSPTAARSSASRASSWSSSGASSGQSPTSSRATCRTLSAASGSPASLRSSARLRACTARSGRSRVSCSASDARATRRLGLVALAALDGDGRLHAVGGTRRLRPSPAAAHGEPDGLVGVAQRAQDLAAERARHREVRGGGEGGPVVARVDGVGVGPLEMRGRGVEVAGPELDDAELSEDEGAHAAAQVAALEDGGLRSSSSRAARSAALGSPRRRPSYRPIAARLAAKGARRLRRHERLALLGAAQVGLRAGVVAAREQRTAERQRELGRGLDAARRGIVSRMGRSVPISPLTIIGNQRVVVRSAARSQAPPAAAWRRARGVVAVRGEPGRGAPVQLRDARRGAARAARRAAARRTAGGSDATCRARRAASSARRRAPGAPASRWPSRRPGQRVGELGAQRVDDRRAQQEVAQLRWLAGEHLADQVVADRRVGAGEVLDEVARVGMVLQRHRRQAQRGRPALGAPPERREVLGAPARCRARRTARRPRRARSPDRPRGSRSGCRRGAGGRVRSAGPPA